MKRFTLFLLSCLLVFSLAACKKKTDTPTDETSAPVAVLVVEGKETRVPLSGLTAWNLPAAPTLANGVFAAWQKEGENPRLFSAGEAYGNLPQSGEIVFRALAVRFGETLTATPNVSENSLSLAFSISGEDVRALGALSDEMKLGVLIAPYAAVTGGGRTFTIDCGEADLKNFALTPDLTAVGDYLLCGSTDTVADAEILEKFAARPYISFRCGDKWQTLYPAYLPLIHTASLYGAVAAATEDVVATPTDAYPFAVDTDAGVRYSALPTVEYALLRAFLNKAVFVDTAACSVASKYALNNVDFFDFRCYVSPYIVARVEENDAENTSTFVVVGKDAQTDFRTLTAYFVGGSYRPPAPAEWHDDGLYITVSNKVN